MTKTKNQALILFVKAPRPGAVKTRLQPQLTPQIALQLYRAMVEDLLDTVKTMSNCDIHIYYYPADAYKEVHSWLGEKWNFHPQQGEDLGARMANAFADLVSQTYPKIVLAGSDIPSIELQTIKDAFNQLGESDLVIGPCDDGGYYLIGMKQLHRQIFQDMNWSHDQVLKQTLHKAHSAGLEVRQLEMKSDIDSFADVKELWINWLKTSAHTNHPAPKRTFQVLQKIFL